MVNKIEDGQKKDSRPTAAAAEATRKHVILPSSMIAQVYGLLYYLGANGTYLARRICKNKMPAKISCYTQNVSCIFSTDRNCQ